MNTACLTLRRLSSWIDRASWCLASVGLLLGLAGALPSQVFAQSPDTTTLPPSLTAPIAGTVAGAKFSVAFRLPEAALSGSVKLTFSGTTTTVLTLAASTETSGPHSFNFNPANPTATAAIASGTPIPDGVYTVTLSYQDAAGNAPSTASASGVTIDATGPKGGTFVVTGKAPIVAGRLLTATFRNWTDPSKPLTYGVYADDGSGEFVVVSPGTSAVPTFRLPEGTFAVRGRVFDRFGNATTTTDVQLNVGPLTTDLISPTVKILKPVATTVLGPFAITGNVKENFAIQSFTVTVNGVVRPLDVPLKFVANTLLPWSVSGVTPQAGINTIVVEVVDFAGHTATDTRSVTLIARTDLSTTYNALLAPTGNPDLGTIGLLTISVTSRRGFTGRISLGGFSIPLTGTIDLDGTGRFRANHKTVLDLIGKADFDTYLGALAFHISGTGMTGTLSTDVTGATVLANFAAQQAPYTTLNRVPTAFLNQPAIGTPTSGYYTLAFPTKEQNPVIDHTLYPQGSGFAVMNLSGIGTLTVTGRLADGTRFTSSSRLRADGSFPIFDQIYNHEGAIAGEVLLSDLLDSDATGTNLLWMRPALPRARYYPAGWPAGIRVDATGTKYNKPTSFDFGQGPADPLYGNALLNFTDGLLTAPTSRALSFNPGTASLKLFNAPGKSYRLFFNKISGLLIGTFTHDGVTDSFSGALLSKGANSGGYGYFLSTPPLVYGASGQAGGMSLRPNTR